MNQTEANGGHRSDRTLDRTRSLFDRTRPVSAKRSRVFQFFDRTRWRVRSRSIGRVRSLWELTGLQPDAGTVASGATSSASGHCFVGALLGLTSASGQLRDQRVRLSLARPIGYGTSASGWATRCDQRVRSARLQLFRVSNGSIRRGTSINTHWPAQGSLPCILWHTCEHFELSNSSPTHLSCFFAYLKWDWVI
jgi:hypothetical protein